MYISEFSVKKPITIVMMVLLTIVLGIVSLTMLPVDLYPDIEVPVAIVRTTYDGVGSEEIEELITKPIEKALAGVDDIDQINSISSEGSSTVIAMFDFGIDMDNTTLDMREKVDRVKGYLPEDASEPLVIKIDPNATPIMNISLTGNKDLAKLQSIAENDIQPRLERISGVASVDIDGGYEDEIEIKVNQEKMNGYGLTIDYISKTLASENMNLPSGEVKRGEQELNLRATGEFKSIEEIENLPIALPKGGIVYLKDITHIEFKHKEIDSIAKTNGNSCLLLSVNKQSKTNTVKTSEMVLKEIESLQKEIPQIKVNILYDSAEYINDSINNVIKNALIGGILAIFVLFTFLRNIRTTLIIGTAIPISIIAAFALMYFSGVTINMMTLGGLALGIGMLVDNSIVVLENIYRFRQDGYSRKDAAIQASREVGMSVTASTLTTIAVFMPIVFVGGITSIIFKEFALTVTVSLVASLLVALTLIPMLSSKYLKVDQSQGNHHHERFKFFSLFFDAFDSGFAKLEANYKKLLNKALIHRKKTVIASLLIFFISLGSVFTVGMEFFPTTDEGTFSINVELPEGVALEETSQIATEIENQLHDITEIQTITSKVGTGGGSRLTSKGGNKASIDINLVDLSDRKRGTNEVADEVRKITKDIPGADISVTASSSGMGGSSAPVTINIEGDNLDTLQTIGNDFVDLVKTVEGTREVESSYSEGIPEVQMRINRERASQYGLTVGQIVEMVKGTVSGKKATTYKIDGDEIDVVVEGDEIFKESIDNLKQISIQTPSGSRIPLSNVAEINLGRGPATINREDETRVVTVTSQLLGRDLQSVIKDTETKLVNYNLPEGYTYEFTGENEDMMESFSALGMALILAVVIVYMILASQFESLLHPFTIMFSLPLAISGGGFALAVTRRPASVPAFIGFIMLAGIVVNNAIVLIDYINTRRERGETRNEAIVNAGPIRLRPILMTTSTTVLGLIPLAIGIGEGAETQAPMATVVIGGLLLSTLLTLVFIPVLYTIFDDFSAFIAGKLHRKSKKNELEAYE